MCKYDDNKSSFKSLLLTIIEKTKGHSELSRYHFSGTRSAEFFKFLTNSTIFFFSAILFSFAVSGNHLFIEGQVLLIQFFASSSGFYRSSSESYYFFFCQNLNCLTKKRSDEFAIFLVVQLSIRRQHNNLLLPHFDDC